MTNPDNISIDVKKLPDLTDPSALQGVFKFVFMCSLTLIPILLGLITTKLFYLENKVQELECKVVQSQSVKPGHE